MQKRQQPFLGLELKSCIKPAVPHTDLHRLDLSRDTKLTIPKTSSACRKALSALCWLPSHAPQIRLAIQCSELRAQNLVPLIPDQLHPSLAVSSFAHAISGLGKQALAPETMASQLRTVSQFGRTKFGLCSVHISCSQLLPLRHVVASSLRS